MGYSIRNLPIFYVELSQRETASLRLFRSQFPFDFEIELRVENENVYLCPA